MTGKKGYHGFCYQLGRGHRRVCDLVLKKLRSRKCTSPGMVSPRPHPGARPGVGARRRAPGGPQDPAGCSSKGASAM